MTHTFVHSDIEIAEVFKIFPSARIFAPCAESLPTSPPYLLCIEIADEYANVQCVIRDVEKRGAGLVELSHPRDKAAFSDTQIASLQKHTPQVKKGDCMADLLGYIHAATQASYWDPSLRCV